MRKTNDITTGQVASTGSENQKSIDVNRQQKHNAPVADPSAQMERDRDQLAADFIAGLHSPAFQTALGTIQHATPGLNATAAEEPAATKALTGAAAVNAGAAKVASVVEKPA